ncbi:MAG TPA: response regulator, partial [Verrucomicrobiae bacterium]|nr:response regulator [Verrucomicrobiae bacterium]
TGIPPTVLARIFEPFFTTKPVGKGTGLGLSTARQIIQQHGGFMTIQTEVGWGTEFKVYFPALPSAAAAGAGSPEALPSGNGETILVVDDEASILDITTQTLRRSNYDVLTARDGAQAMAVFFQNRDKIKLVLTELTLPIMDGGALIRALQSVDARLQIIVSSSPIDDGRETDMTQYKVQFFLQKPYTAPQLLGAIHKSLQAPC